MQVVPGAPGKLPPVDGKKEKGATAILNQILPPKEWMEDGVSYTQNVSDAPATRLDVIKLQVRNALACLSLADTHVHNEREREKEE